MDKSRCEVKILCSLKIWLLVEGHYLKNLEVQNNNNMLMKQMTGGELEVLADVVRMVTNFFGGKKRNVYEN